jgi:MFS family permease
MVEKNNAIDERAILGADEMENVPRRIEQVTAVQQRDDNSQSKRLRKAYCMWGLGMAGYIFAVACRSSFSAIATDAAIHLNASSAALSSFVYLQLCVYAMMQIPAGVLLDRFGARRLIVAGCLSLALGQGIMAFAPGIAVAVSGRVIVGLGDSLIFIPVIRLAASWFPVRQLPLINQLTGQIGGVGQIISVYPFAGLLHIAGWRAAFLSLSGVGVLIAVCVMLGVRDQPYWKSIHTSAEAQPKEMEVPARLTAWSAMCCSIVQALKSPGTWCAFCVHGCTWFSANVLYLLWGVPFLETVEQVSYGTASMLLAFAMVMNVIWALTLGHFTCAHPVHGRTGAIAVSVVAQMAVWAVLLCAPRPVPIWVLVLFFVILSTGAPCANMALDYARETNNPRVMGTATGFSNTAGFVVSAIVLLLIGVVLDMQGATTPARYTPHAMRFAMITQYPFWIAGIVGFVLTLPHAWESADRLRG